MMEGWTIIDRSRAEKLLSGFLGAVCTYGKGGAQGDTIFYRPAVG